MSPSTGEASFDEQDHYGETIPSIQEDISPRGEVEQKRRMSVKKQRSTLTDAVSTILKKKASEESKESKESKILSRRKAPERKLAEAKLEAAARRVLRAERLVHRDVAHATSNLDPNHEKRLRKTATRGVVQIFNAIKQRIHTKEQQEAERKARKTATLNATRLQQGESMPVKEQGLQMSFLELLKTNMTSK